MSDKQSDMPQYRQNVRKTIKLGTIHVNVQFVQRKWYLKSRDAFFKRLNCNKVSQLCSDDILTGRKGRSKI